MMNHSFKLNILLPALLVLVACTPKDTPRYVHEGPRAWAPVDAPEDDSVDAASMVSIDLSKAYAIIKAGQGDALDTILKPLAPFVLNKKIVEAPANRTTKMAELISVFNAGMYLELKNNDTKPEFLKIKKDYYDTVFAGCTRDLRLSCQNASLFSSQPWHLSVFTLLASEMDPQVEAQLKTYGTPQACIDKSAQCRDLIEERYRLLSMGLYNKRAHGKDTGFDFAYLKYAMMFGLYLEHIHHDQQNAPEGDYSDMSYSYLSELNSKLFQTIIAKYQPNYQDPGFKSFVENFDPWTYSRKSSDLFQYGTSVMFNFATKCCMYKNAEKTQVSDEVKQAIHASQVAADQFGPSFTQMIEDIKKDHGDRLFQKLGIMDLIRRIEQPGSDFFNEYFFIVDRLFRGHLSSEDVANVLNNSNPVRARQELPRMITDYTKIYLVYMVVQTNRFMSDVYHSDIASDKIFETAVVRSRELTDRWHSVASSIDLLDKLLGSYFKGLNLTNDSGFVESDKILKAVDRNIHYLSVFPNMIVLNYYLAQMNGKIVVTSWWGRIELQAETILQLFFNGNIGAPWFHFGVDTESLDRTNLLYSLEYLLSTETINSFVAKNSKADGNDRSKFFDLIFSRYLGDLTTSLQTQMQDFSNKVFNDSNMAVANEVCNYTLGHTNTIPSPQVISFTDLRRFTYTGLGDNGLNKVLNDYLNGASGAVDLLMGDIDFRRTYVEAMMHVIAEDLIRSGQIKTESDKHPDLTKARELLSSLDHWKAVLASGYIEREKFYYDCESKLIDIERYRANRLYEEERSYLGWVFDIMKPLNGIQDPNTLNAKADELNQKYFPKSSDGTPVDRIVGKNFHASQYQLLLRMKKRIEGDIFTTPTADELKVYSPETLQDIVRPRPVTVDMPDGLSRDDMVAQGTNTTLFLRGSSEADKADFVRQGMALLNGKNQAYIEWRAQIESQTTVPAYLNLLEKLYLMGPVQDLENKTVQVSADELVKSYVKFLGGLSLDDFDLKNLPDFGANGLHPRSFYEGMLFDQDGQTRLPLFYKLMKDVTELAKVSLTSTDGPVQEALKFAKDLNNQQAFVFPPSSAVHDAVQGLYGDRVNRRLQRVNDLYVYLKKLESTKEVADLDPRLTRPFLVDGNQTYSWFTPGYKNLMDAQKYRDQQFLIQDFTQQTGDFYQTREKVRLP